MTHDLAVNFFLLSKGQRTQRLGENLDAVNPHCYFARLCAEKWTMHTDDVTEIQVRQQRVHLLAELIPLEIELNFAG